ncbi:hypothetical protein TTHERM_00016080 (macronuclear) [Tetrahymena thermophila SB210]|uniref:Uncharacterized protein n=1 Tax=Tetrahymena thermophila (strain SB210) TaxID=312017 RepID=Q22RH9_TETTS|nr:hypothetical protein TTHERM_00016080 [Tetrahymena thermophila SB210]EAR88143.2 hypothetical protein TTHERM_00016080 [Tetrahymena thermophila SB210]|eukprot:XP_001008388.2 hypothetical protein TTHERM_00016080 [Tetrahymena thermophila SB210]
MKGGFIKPSSMGKQPKKTVILKDNDLKSFDKEYKKDDVLNKEYMKMQQFMLVSGQPQLNIMESKIKDLDEKMNGNRNQMSLDDELELRKIMMKQTKFEKMMSNYYENYLSYSIPKDPEQSVHKRLQNVSNNNQIEIQNIINLHNKLQQSTLQDPLINQKEFKFPQTTRVFEEKKKLDEDLLLMNQSQQILDGIKSPESKNQTRTQRVNSQGIQIQDDGYEDEDDDDSSQNSNEVNSKNDLDNLTEKSLKSSKSRRSVRSNFDRTSRYSTTSRISKGKGQFTNEWEYNSLNEYDIEDIPKLIEEEKVEFYVMPQEVTQVKAQQEQKEQDNTQKQTDQDGKSNKDKDKQKEKEKDKQNEKSQKEENKIWKKSKKKILFIQQELSNDEFLKLNIHEMLSYVQQVDYIQKFSFAYGQAGTIHPENQIQYHRDLTTQARDMLTIDPEVRGNYFEQDRAGLLEIEDIYIDMNKITFEDVTNIISDRVSDYFIKNCIDPKYLAENYEKFSYIPEKNNNVLDKMQYTQSLQDIKKSQYLEMKSYYQKMKTWDNKDMQISYKDIIKETKTVTDWVLEDLFHIRKATMNSYDLDFDPKVNQIFQTQFYHKFEQKLLILLQIILYRQNIPSFKVPKDLFGKPTMTEEQQKAERIKIEKQRAEQEKKFFKLFTPEEKLVQDLKDLLKNVGKISNEFVDGRSKVELLRIFLVDYNEIVKFKTEQLNRVKKIEEQITQINSEFSQIEGKTLYERLFEAKIGHLKDQENEEVTDAQILDQLSQKREQLLKEREAILLNSAQLFSVKQESEETQNNLNNQSQSDQKSKSPSPTPRDNQQVLNKNGDNVLVSRARNLKNVARAFNLPVNQADKKLEKNFDLEQSQEQNQDLLIPLYKADSQYQAVASSQTPQKGSMSNKRNTSTTPNRNLKNSQFTPISTTKSRNMEDSRSEQFSRNQNNKYSQKSLFSQYNPQKETYDRTDSRLSNRQILNDTSMQDDEYRDQLGMQYRRTPENFHRQTKHSNTYAEQESNDYNQVKQIKLFKNARTKEYEQSNLVLNKSRTISQNGLFFDGNSNETSKSPFTSTSKLLKQSYSQQFSDQDFTQTKLERQKRIQQNNSSNRSVSPFAINQTQYPGSKIPNTIDSFLNEDTSLKIIQKNLNTILKENLVLNQNQNHKRHEHSSNSKMSNQKTLKSSRSQLLFQDQSNYQPNSSSKSPIREVQSSLEMITNKNWKQVFKTASCRKNKNTSKDKKY